MKMLNGGREKLVSGSDDFTVIKYVAIYIYAKFRSSSGIPLRKKSL